MGNDNLIKKLSIFLFLIASCSSENILNQSDERKLILAGECKDLEQPSRFKDPDSYKVNGWFSVYLKESDIILQSGYLFIEPEEISSRFDNIGSVEDYPSLNHWMAVTDLPVITIWDLPSNLLSQDRWVVPSIHNYDDTGEYPSSYADLRGECRLEVTERVGEMPTAIFEKDVTCFDADCSLDFTSS